MNKHMVLKLGGSVLYDKSLNLNINLLQKLKNWYHDEKNNFQKLVIVVGGGTFSRDVQKRVANSIGGDEYLHNIGMAVTQTNAAIVQGYLEDPDIYIPRKIGDAYEYIINNEKVVMVSGGLKVGWSTDMDAAVFADILDCDRVFKISDIEYLYNKDPKEHIDASPIKDITWGEYFDLFKIDKDSMHHANHSIPIDVGCALFCQSKNISFIISGGKKLQEEQSIGNILSEGSFIHN